MDEKRSMSKFWEVLTAKKYEGNRTEAIVIIIALSRGLVRSGYLPEVVEGIIDVVIDTVLIPAGILTFSKKVGRGTNGK